MSVANLPRTFLALVITVGSVLITFLTAIPWLRALIWILAGFSLVAYANSFLIKKIFANTRLRSQKPIRTPGTRTLPPPKAWKTSPETRSNLPAAKDIGSAEAKSIQYKNYSIQIGIPNFTSDMLPFMQQAFIPRLPAAAGEHFCFRGIFILSMSFACRLSVAHKIS